VKKISIVEIVLAVVVFGAVLCGLAFGIPFNRDEPTRVESNTIVERVVPSFKTISLEVNVVNVRVRENSDRIYQFIKNGYKLTYMYKGVAYLGIEEEPEYTWTESGALYVKLPEIRLISFERSDFEFIGLTTDFWRNGVVPIDDLFSDLNEDDAVWEIVSNPYYMRQAREQLKLKVENRLLKLGIREFVID
jgi:hypothetical protein